MKRFSALLITAAATTLLAGTAVAQSGRLSDVGGAHNFTDDLYRGAAAGLVAGNEESVWNTTGEICQPCHTPHGSSSPTGTMATGLLWSHNLSTNGGSAWTMYTSSTLDGGGATEPLGYDKMCLSCHDGTVGVDAFAHNTQPGIGPVLITNALGGNVFGYDTWAKHPGVGLHPISVDYDADAGMNDKLTTPMGISGNIVDVLEGGNMVGCASCHDVHEDQVPDGVHELLRVDNAASALCLTCHDK